MPQRETVNTQFDDLLLNECKFTLATERCLYREAMRFPPTRYVVRKVGVNALPE